MSERLSNKEFLGILKETFKRGQELRFTPTGRSMLPMLDGVNDTVTFAPVVEKSSSMASIPATGSPAIGIPSCVIRMERQTKAPPETCGDA